MISRTFTLWLICICPFAVDAHAYVLNVVIARHVIIASDHVMLTSCLFASVDHLCMPYPPASFLSRGPGPLSRRNVIFRAAAGGRPVLRMSIALQI